MSSLLLSCAVIIISSLSALLSVAQSSSNEKRPHCLSMKSTGALAWLAVSEMNELSASCFGARPEHLQQYFLAVSLPGSCAFLVKDERGRFLPPTLLQASNFQPLSWGCYKNRRDFLSPGGKALWGRIWCELFQHIAVYFQTCCRCFDFFFSNINK